MDIPPVPRPFSKLQALVLHPELMNFGTECMELIAIWNSLWMLEPSTNYAKLSIRDLLFSQLADINDITGISDCICWSSQTFVSLSLGKPGRQDVSRNFRLQWAGGEAHSFRSPHQPVHIDTGGPDSQPWSVSPTSISSAISMQVEASGHISPVGWPVFFSSSHWLVCADSGNPQLAAMTYCLNVSFLLPDPHQLVPTSVCTVCTKAHQACRGAYWEQLHCDGTPQLILHSKLVLSQSVEIPSQLHYRMRHPYQMGECTWLARRTNGNPNRKCR